MTAPNDNAERTGEKPPTTPLEAAQGARSFFWLAIALHALGTAFALLPLHWYTAGVLLAVLGQTMCLVLAKNKVFTLPGEQLDVRRYGQRLALTGLLHGLAVIVPGATTAALPPSRIGLGVTFAILRILPAIFGFRLLTAVTGWTAPAGLSPEQRAGTRAAATPPWPCASRSGPATRAPACSLPPTAASEHSACYFAWHCSRHS